MANYINNDMHILCIELKIDNCELIPYLEFILKNLFKVFLYTKNIIN